MKPKEYKLKQLYPGLPANWEVGMVVKYNANLLEAAIPVDPKYYVQSITMGQLEKWTEFWEPVKTEDDIAKSIVQEIWDVIDEGLNNEYRESQTLAKIEQIIASNSKVPVVEESAGKGVKNSQKIVLVTEDQKCIYDIQQIVYGVDIENWETTEFKMYNAQDMGYNPPNIKWFSEPENRQEFVEYHKPILSQKEIIEEVIAKAEIYRGSGIDPDVVEIIKCRLDSYVIDKLSNKQYGQD